MTVRSRPHAIKLVTPSELSKVQSLINTLAKAGVYKVLHSFWYSSPPHIFKILIFSPEIALLIIFMLWYAIFLNVYNLFLIEISANYTLNIAKVCLIWKYDIQLPDISLKNFLYHFQNLAKHSLLLINLTNRSLPLFPVWYSS